MKSSHLKVAAAVAVVAITLGFFQNCGQVEFAQKAEESGASLGTPDPGAPPPVNPPPNVICDPFDKKNIIDPKAGIEGTIHYATDRLDKAMCLDNALCTSQDYVNLGTKVDAVLFLSQIFVPTRNFSQGFDVQGGGKLEDGNKNVLVEWFALDLRSQFVLDANDEEGNYQFAIVSDDGNTLTVNGSKMIVDEGEHSPRLACSSGTLPMTKTSKVPFHLTYFQGPRTQISLVMLWRKVAAGANLTDCGTSDGYITDQNNLPQALSSRGWKVLKASNFELSSGKNLCAMTN